jgi:hypothetical protein
LVGLGLLLEVEAERDEVGLLDEEVGLCLEEVDALRVEAEEAGTDLGREEEALVEAESGRPAVEDASGRDFLGTGMDCSYSIYRKAR